MRSRGELRKRRLKDICREAFAFTIAGVVWGAVCGWLLLPIAAFEYIVTGKNPLPRRRRAL